jgi:DNA-binding GntR family transcriptional regulator
MSSADAVAPAQVKEVVYRKLRDALIDHQFAPGEPLREVALCARYEVSKTPIREALLRLDHDGLVEIAPYRGARARVYTADDVQEFFQVREMLECECVRLAVDRPEVVGRLRKNVQQTRAALTAGDLTRTAARLDAFDEILFGVLRNRLLEELIERLSLHLRRLGKMGAARRRFEESIVQHEAILVAIESGDAGRAQEAMRTHLSSVLAAQIAGLEGVVAASGAGQQDRNGRLTRSVAGVRST